MQLAQIIDDNEIVNYDLLTTKYIKVLRAKEKKDLRNLNKEFYLVDAFIDNFGGEGKRIALEWFDDIDCSRLILAGGLNSSNIKEIDGYGFYGVDVSSGVESEIRGKKDRQKMIDFVKEANELK
jgi:phosphoribosylanthranilate isomerase